MDFANIWQIILEVQAIGMVKIFGVRECLLGS